MSTYIFTLAADEGPLCKTFDVTNKLKKTPSISPLLTSTRHEVGDFEGMCGVIESAAETGSAVLKGLLTKDITRQSRKGLTNKTAPTWWMCLDVDEHYDGMSPQMLLQAIGVTGVPVLFRHSSSAGVKHPPGCRGHYFIWLGHPVPPKNLKAWLQLKNFTIPILRDRLHLTQSMCAIHYALDPCLADNSRLIFVAPPVFESGVDLIENRSVLFEMSGSDKWIDEIEQANPLEAKRESADFIASAHKRLGFKPTKEMREFIETGSCAPIVAKGLVDSIEIIEEDDRFIRLNLNGGDSRGYYIDKLVDPNVILNFKGEPPIDLARSNRKEFEKIRQSLGESDTRVDVCWVPKAGAYIAIESDPKTGLLQDHTVLHSKSEALDYLSSHGLPAKRFSVYQQIYEPGKPAIDHRRRIINLYYPTEYEESLVKEFQTPVKQIPTVIDKILNHLCNYDKDVHQHLVNWLAVLIQYKTRTETAWVFSGTQGTGKNLLIDRVLKPLLGEGNVATVLPNMVLDKFNDWMANRLLIFVNECSTSHMSKGDQDKFTSAIKAVITDATIPVRGMHRSARTVPNVANLIIGSNDNVPYPVSPADRRLNIAPRQSQRLAITTKEIDSIESELLPFARYLYDYKADREQARTIIQTAERESQIKAQRSPIVDLVCRLKDGQLDYFVNILKQTPIDMDGGASPTRVLKALHVVTELHHKALAVWNGSGSTQPVFISLHDIVVILNAVYNASHSGRQLNVRMILYILQHTAADHGVVVVSNAAGMHGIEAKLIPSTLLSEEDKSNDSNIPGLKPKTIHH